MYTLCHSLELRRRDLMPSDSEFSTMETFIKIIKPLVDITQVIGVEGYNIEQATKEIHVFADKYLSDSKVIPLATHVGH